MMCAYIRLLAAKSIRIVPLSMLFVCTWSNGLAQSGSCTLATAALKQPDELVGFHLGMTPADATVLVPTLELGRTDKTGRTQTSFTPALMHKLDQNRFKGIRTISLEFLDGKLMLLWIGYAADFKWSDLDEFQTHMAPALGIAQNDWERRSMGRRFLRCDGFEAMIQAIGGGPGLRLTDLASKDVWDRRRADAAAAVPEASAP